MVPTAVIILARCEGDERGGGVGLSVCFVTVLVELSQFPVTEKISSQSPILLTVLEQNELHRFFLRHTSCAWQDLHRCGLFRRQLPDRIQAVSSTSAEAEAGDTALGGYLD